MFLFTMNFLDKCHFDELTEELQRELLGIDCRRELKIERFFKEESLLSDSQMLSHTYCFYEKVDNEDGSAQKHAVAGFCVSCSNVATKLIPKSTRNKLNRKIPYGKQRDHYPAVMIGQLTVFDSYAGKGIGDELMEKIKWWLVVENQNIASRYIIVDAINKPQVLDFYFRNGFSFAFPDVNLEREYVGVQENEILRTRFMLFDLMPIRQAIYC